MGWGRVAAAGARQQAVPKRFEQPNQQQQARTLGVELAQRGPVANREHGDAGTHAFAAAGQDEGRAAGTLAWRGGGGCRSSNTLSRCHVESPLACTASAPHRQTPRWCTRRVWQSGARGRAVGQGGGEGARREGRQEGREGGRCQVAGQGAEQLGSRRSLEGPFAQHTAPLGSPSPGEPLPASASRRRTASLTSSVPDP